MKIDHIGIATRGIEESLGFWRDALGLEVKHTETVEEQGVRVAMLPVGEPRVELYSISGGGHVVSTRPRPGRTRGDARSAWIGLPDVTMRT